MSSYFRRFVEQLLDKLKKLSCLVFSLMKKHIFQKRFSWFCVVGLPIRKQKPLPSCAVNVGVYSTAQAIFAKLNQFIEQHGCGWMKYKAVATNGAAAMQCTTNGAVRKIKNISLNRVSTCFGESFQSQAKVVVSQFGHNAIFSHTKMSQDKK